MNLINVKVGGNYMNGTTNINQQWIKIVFKVFLNCTIAKQNISKNKGLYVNNKHGCFNIYDHLPYVFIPSFPYLTTTADLQ